MHSFEIQAQPDDVTCGPTCLHAVYRHYGDRVPLTDIVAEVPSLSLGGTLAVLLACHALRRGYRATLYTYNLQIFDPSWFTPVPQELADKLEAQAARKRGERLHMATRGYLDYLELGGQICCEPLTRELIQRLTQNEQPVLTGLSATYLYQESRERADTNKPDDIRGVSTGHFVVLCGYDAERQEVMVADPLHPNPLAPTRQYTAAVDLVMGAILLGVMTYDANLLILDRPVRRDESRPEPASCN